MIRGGCPIPSRNLQEICRGDQKSCGRFWSGWQFRLFCSEHAPVQDHGDAAIHVVDDRERRYRAPGTTPRIRPSSSSLANEKGAASGENAATPQVDPGLLQRHQKPVSALSVLAQEKQTLGVTPLQVAAQAPTVLDQKRGVADVPRLWSMMPSSSSMIVSCWLSMGMAVPQTESVFVQAF